jgi:hypothetical protein
VRKTVFALILGIQAASAANWALSGLPKAVYRVSILNDVSRSMVDGCSAVGALVEDSLALPVLPGSTLMYFSTGDRRTTYEPNLLLSYQLPATTRIFEAKDFRKDKARISDAISSECVKSHPTEVSPIVQAAKTIVQQMQSMGCGNGVHCILMARTDARETVNREVRAALNSEPSKRIQIPIVIDNKDIDVRVCGLAQTRGQVLEANGNVQTFSRLRSDRLEEVWRKLFVYPERVAIEPLCVSRSASTSQLASARKDTPPRNDAPEAAPRSRASDPIAQPASTQHHLREGNFGVQKANTGADTSKTQSVLRPRLAEALKRILEKAQRDNVRLSWGQDQGQCYTSENLQADLVQNKPAAVLNALKKDRDFIAIAIALKEMSADQRTALTSASRVALHKTWTELGRVGPEGQTDAGKQMELLIVNALIDGLLEMADKGTFDLQRALASAR